MTLPVPLDFDKLARPALADAAAALSGWLGGHPRDETAFLNRLTEKLSRRRRGCDVGAASPLSLETTLAMLHRRGPRQTDRYGCDLAVTLAIEPSIFLKTVLFQFKRSADFRVDVPKAQLDDALIDPRIGDRSFVLALEEVRQALRIKSVSALHRTFTGQAERTFDALSWRGATEWLYSWLRCDIGPSSLGQGATSVEPLLQQFVIEPPQIGLFGDLATYVGDDFPVIPARAWLQISFAPSEPR